MFVIEIVLLGHDTQTILSCALPVVLLGIIGYLHRVHHASADRTCAAVTRKSLRLATLAERERIGRDLHDLLGHTLSVVALKSELARKLIDRDLDAARSEIGEVERVARDALAQVRNAVSGIRSTALSAELVAATALLEAQGVKVKCETENVKLPHDRETALALSLREAATNIRRHSGASGVTIRVRKESAAVVVEVVDDGRGGRIVPGNGLNGMRERLGSVGGTLSLMPNKDGGTLLRAVGAHRRMIRILLAEDQAMVRGALGALLKMERDIEVLGAAADGMQALSECRRLRPDIVVTDIEMPGMTGIELAQKIQADGLPCKVVIVTTFARQGYLRRALDAGVKGYLLKDSPAEKLAEALRNVHRGGKAIDPALAVEAWNESDPLNDRERQTLRLSGEGLSAPQIAEQLGLSAGTVRNYLSEAIGKLGANNRIDAYRLARQRGWL